MNSDQYLKIKNDLNTYEIGTDRIRTLNFAKKNLNEEKEITLRTPSDCGFKFELTKHMRIALGQIIDNEIFELEESLKQL
ncbi:hypothetical protein [Clostridium tagluense]|nr:hypothetical protein [Clostridium tagluense]